MRLIVFPDDYKSGTDFSLLRTVLSEDSLCPLVLNALGRCIYSDMQGPGRSAKMLQHCLRKVFYRFPRAWKDPEGGKNTCVGSQPIVTQAELNRADDSPWLVISNGCYVTRLNARLFGDLLLRSKADIHLIRAAPNLMDYREKPLIKRDQSLVGIRRFYEDCIEPRPIPGTWPHHLVLNTAKAKKMGEQGFTAGFASFLARLYDAGLKVESWDIAGKAWDVTHENNLLEMIIREIGSSADGPNSTIPGNGVAGDVQVTGPVIWGRDVEIKDGVVIMGPAVIGDGAKIGKKAIAKKTLVLSGAEIENGSYVHDCITQRSNGQSYRPIQLPDSPKILNPWDLSLVPDAKRYKTWPNFGYANCVKRFFDIVFALTVLILFVPIAPLIAIAIKWDSKGPVFYLARRQGRFGVEFNCFKFRTMRTGAEALQDGLRSINEVDGPQFKMADDPRISRVGSFLRETYLDEVPQFINVLLGQMSVVGPRPSPRSENTLCPWWRDSRLSVRPGVTGLWQVKRTRREGKDFQEWIQYDTEYVNGLSLKKDLWIVWATSVNMLSKFLEQF